jgi:hypothetical protein
LYIGGELVQFCENTELANRVLDGAQRFTTNKSSNFADLFR